MSARGRLTVAVNLAKALNLLNLVVVAALVYVDRSMSAAKS